MLLANVWLREDGVDKMGLMLDIFTETCLHLNALDQAIALDGQTVFQAGRVEDSGRMKEGGAERFGCTCWGRLSEHDRIWIETNF